METTPFYSGFVTIIGEPNVGKSTLLNAFVGSKLAIVSPKPQTTRHRILGVKNLPNAQLIFLDTPGIHQPRTELSRYMMQAVTEALESPEVVLYMTDVTRQPQPDSRFCGGSWGGARSRCFGCSIKLTPSPRTRCCR